MNLILLYIILIIIISYYLFKINNILLLIKLKYLINSKYSNLYIISNDKCECKKNILFTCDKCIIENLCNIESYNDNIRLCSNINENDELNIIVHTIGGYSKTIDLISLLLKKRKGKVNIYVPKYAYSSGTMLILSADNIYMNWYSVGGPVDTQIDFVHNNELENNYSVRYIRKLKKCNMENDKQFLQGCLAEDYYNECKLLLEKILQDNKNSEIIIQKLLNNDVSHDYFYTKNEFKNMGLNIVDNVPSHIMKIFNLYKKIFS